MDRVGARRTGLVMVLPLCALLLVCAAARAEAGDYQLGRGIAVSDALTVGGYFSSEYFSGDNQR